MPTSLLPRSRRARAAALLLALPLLAGCSAATTPTATHTKGSSSNSSSSSGSGSFVEKKPCDYLSDAQASAAIGTKLTSSEANGACSYSGAHLAGFAMTITRISGADDSIWKDQVTSIKEDDATAIAGVGDEAYGGRSVAEEKVIVRKGDAMIEVADADGLSKNYTKSIAVAKAIIANLGN
jgi:hypothetical protein